MRLIYNNAACDSGIQNTTQELHSVYYQVILDIILKEKDKEKERGGGAENKTNEITKEIASKLSIHSTHNFKSSCIVSLTCHENVFTGTHLR